MKLQDELKLLKELAPTEHDETKNHTCLSVVGGWQTKTPQGTLIGPVFNKIQDLWNWQSKNL